MSQNVNWDKIRANAWAKESAPEWPHEVNAISMEGLTLFGLDEGHRLYWDGRLVEVRRGLGLTRVEKFMALLTVASAVTVAAFTVIGYFWPPG